MDAVFALQRSGTDAVFAYQFPVAATVAQGSGAGLGAWPYQQPITTRQKSLRELQQEQDAEQARAAEIADAAVARAAGTAEPLADLEATLTINTLLGLMPAQAALDAQPTGLVLAQPSEQRLAFPHPALDEDAILAATMLLRRRRA